MSGLDDLNRAADEARDQVRAARDALAASRTARGGAPARSAKEAERQLAALRAAVSDDALLLRDRLAGGQDPAASGALRNAVLATAAAVTGVVGLGLLGRGAVRRGAERRSLQRQAVSLARVFAQQGLTSTSPGSRPRSDASTAPASRGRGGGILLLALAGAAAAGAVLVQQQRGAPVDPDDLWLPERSPGPA